MDEQRGREYASAWWRAMFGDLPFEDPLDEHGRPHDPLLVPASAVGRIAALRLAPTSLRVSAERRRQATRLLEVIEEALRADDDRAWRLVKDAASALDAAEERRAVFAALERLTTLATFRHAVLALKPRKDERRARRDPLLAFGELSKTSPQKQALETLRSMFPPLAKATDAEVFVALEGVAPDRRRGRGNKSVSVALARLMVRFRFGRGARQVGETEAEAVRRIATSLSDEWRGGRAARR